MRNIHAALAAATLALASGCAERVVVDEARREAIVVEARAPKTSGKHKRGLGLVVQDARTGWRDSIRLARGACPDWRTTAAVGRRIPVWFRTVSVDGAHPVPEATAKGLREMLCSA